jgi:hypothetical protein
MEVDPSDSVIDLVFSLTEGMSLVALPIVRLEPESLGRWARAAVGARGEWVPGFAWSPPDEPAPRATRIPAGGPQVEPDGAERLRRFRCVASEPARRLARLLAASPW